MRNLDLRKIVPYLGGGIILYLAKELFVINAEIFTIMAFITVFIAMKKYLSAALVEELDNRRQAILRSYCAMKQEKIVETRNSTLSTRNNHIKVDIMASIFEKGAGLVKVARATIGNIKLDHLALRTAQEMTGMRNLVRQRQIATVETALNAPIREKEKVRFSKGGFVYSRREKYLHKLELLDNKVGDALMEKLENEIRQVEERLLRGEKVDKNWVEFVEWVREDERQSRAESDEFFKLCFRHFDSQEYAKKAREKVEARILAKKHKARAASLKKSQHLAKLDAMLESILRKFPKTPDDHQFELPGANGTNTEFFPDPEELMIPEPKTRKGSPKKTRTRKPKLGEWVKIVETDGATDEESTRQPKSNRKKKKKD